MNPDAVHETANKLIDQHSWKHYLLFAETHFRCPTIGISLFVWKAQHHQIDDFLNLVD